MSIDRERGFIVVHRQIQSSAIFRSLSAEQRSVLLSILLLANWTPDRFMYGTEWVDVARGELAHGLETIAKHAGVSIKVVRTTVAKLIAGQFLGTRKGTESGIGPRVLTVLNYAKYQDAKAREGTPTGTATGTTGARLGHDSGTAGALREQDQPGEPVSLSPREAGAADRVVAFSQDAVLAEKYPATAAVLGRLNDAGIPMRHAQDNPTRARGELLIARVGVDLAVSRATESYRESGHTTIGWHLRAIEGPRVNGSKAPDVTRGMAPVGTDFTSKPF